MDMHANMSTRSAPTCRFCETVAMIPSVKPATRSSLRIGAWLVVLFGLAIGMFSQGNFHFVLGGLVLAIVAMPLTEPRLARVWLCPCCGHYYPHIVHGESPIVTYRWRVLPAFLAILTLLVIGLGFWIMLAWYGWDLRWFGPSDAIMEKLRIALGFAVIIAVFCVLFESLEHYPEEPFLWRALSMTALLLGLGTTANAATAASWLVTGPAHEWMRLTILIIGEAVILVMAMRRSKFFIHQDVQIPDQ